MNRFYFILLSSLLLLGCTNIKTNPQAITNDLFQQLPMTDDSKVKPVFIPPQPNYPTVARMQQVQGDVEMDVIIDENGIPILVEIISGPTMLYQLAKEHALKFRFEPIISGGKPTISKIHITCPFRLR